MARKDRDRFLRRQALQPDYEGFRGNTAVPRRTPSPETETVVCSVCQRRRNVASDSIPTDRSSYVCLRCQCDAVSD